jgi:hypothetical protein
VTGAASGYVGGFGPGVGFAVACQHLPAASFTQD